MAGIVAQVVASVVRWLRAGYPDGLPPHDYVPLFAVLRRRLSEEEVNAVTEALVRDGHLSEAAAGDAITAVTHQPPLESDLARVSRRLAEGGWPTEYDRGPGSTSSHPTSEAQR
jgi:hypothetical protein